MNEYNGIINNTSNINAKITLALRLSPVAVVSEIHHWFQIK